VADTVVIIGAGGHGREVLDVLEACVRAGLGAEFLGFVDDGEPPEEPVRERGATLLGSTADLDDIGATYVLLGIGDAQARSKVARSLRRPIAPALVHPAATVGSRCSLDVGVVVAAGARLTTNVTVGVGCYVGPNATVGHDTVLGDHATLYPGAVVSGNVTIDAEATIGAGAAVRQGLRIGERAYVGLGASVIADVPAGVTVVGSPARPIELGHGRVPLG
jgi:sugar O-acyltransferase (sialic acid O-acetyltransferase NeuD family)